MTDLYVRRFEIFYVPEHAGASERRYCRADLTDGSTVEHLPFPSAAAKFLEVAQHQRKPIRVVKSGEHPEFEFVEREEPFPRPEQSPPVPFEHVPPEHMVEEIKRQARRINETEFRTGGEKELSEFGDAYEDAKRLTTLRHDEHMAALAKVADGLEHLAGIFTTESRQPHWGPGERHAPRAHLSPAAEFAAYRHFEFQGLIDISKRAHHSGCGCEGPNYLCGPEIAQFVLDRETYTVIALVAP